MKNSCAFNLTEKVIIDGCDSIVAVVTAVMFETSGCTVRVSWTADGQVRREWVEEWRLTKWEE